MPFSLVEAGPEHIPGEGNYVLAIKDTEMQDAAVVYCIDSLAYAPQPHEKNGEYAWLEPAQIEWYQRHSCRITKANRGRPLPSLVFFHIPLPEFNAAWDNESPPPIGAKGERVCCPKRNTGMFATMLECEDVMGVFVGHEHVNDYAGAVNGICLAYGRKAGLDTYGELPLCARIIELRRGKREFETWLHAEGGKTLYHAGYPAMFKPACA
jgi:hypothetical protein